MNTSLRWTCSPFVLLSSTSSCSVVRTSFFVVTSKRNPARYYHQSTRYQRKTSGMTTSIEGMTYDDALDHLNSLQTPFHILAKRRAAGVKPGPAHFQNTLSQLDKIGYSPTDLTKLNIVHVAGTKGKGSVCAYVSSILSQYQTSDSLSLHNGEKLKTGLFTSPHLVSVRERIRINGQPVSPELFAKHFFTVWNRLGLSKEWDESPDAPERPPYFRFLTLLSYHVFLKEGVNAAIYEVGVGGEYDSTNVVALPVATGISKLGIDHVDTLGHTIEEIAWHKAGILKTGAAAFSVPQIEEAKKVVQQRAQEKGVTLDVIRIDPRLEQQNVKILPDAQFQKENASLAIALTSTLLRHLDAAVSIPEDRLPQEFVDGLEKVVWRGRCETIVDSEKPGVTWFVDGAHTVDSLKVAASWFRSASTSASSTSSAAEDETTRIKRVLVFNQQGRDTANDLLSTLYHSIHKTDTNFSFDEVIFCTNTTYKSGWKKDMENKMQDNKVIAELTVQRSFADTWARLEEEEGRKSEVRVLGSIEEAIEAVRSLKGEEGVHALVTGSLHLVGGFLGVLEGEI